MKNTLFYYINNLKVMTNLSTTASFACAVEKQMTTCSPGRLYFLNNGYFLFSPF